MELLLYFDYVIESQKSLKAYAMWLVPTLMVAVFLVQLFMVNQHNLLRWKGAGMGMFSDFLWRSVVVETEVNDEKREIVVPPDLGPYSFAVEMVPNTYYADLLWGMITGHVSFNTEGEQQNKPHRRFMDLPSSRDAMYILFSRDVQTQNKVDTVPVENGTITVYGLTKYSPETGKVTVGTLLKQSYGTESQ